MLTYKGVCCHFKMSVVSPNEHKEISAPTSNFKVFAAVLRDWGWSSTWQGCFTTVRLHLQTSFFLVFSRKQVPDSTKRWADQLQFSQLFIHCSLMSVTTLVVRNRSVEDKLDTRTGARWQRQKCRLLFIYNEETVTINFLLLKPNQCGKSKRASEQYLRVKKASLQTGLTFTSSSVMMWMLFPAQLSSASLKSICHRETSFSITGQQLLESTEWHIQRKVSPAYIQPVAFPSNRRDGLVQIFLQLPLDEGVIAIESDHILLQHWNRIEDNLWGHQDRRMRL